MEGNEGGGDNPPNSKKRPQAEENCGAGGGSSATSINNEQLGKKRKFDHEEFDNKISVSKPMNSKLSSREKRSSKKKLKVDPEDSERTTEKKSVEYETDPDILQRRQKQVDYGKNTVGYQNYINQVPLTKRTKEHPRTPDKYLKYSRRSWDTLIKIWRKKLHGFDPNLQGRSDNDDDSE